MNDNEAKGVYAAISHQAHSHPSMTSFQQTSPRHNRRFMMPSRDGDSSSRRGSRLYLGAIQGRNGVLAPELHYLHLTDISSDILNGHMYVPSFT